MIKRIIFLPQNKLSDRDYDRYGIDIIRNRGYKVEVWDLSPVLRPYYFKNYDLPNPSTYKHIRIFYDKKEIKKSISKLTSTDLIVCLYSMNKSTYFIFNGLDESHIKYGFISLTSHPENYSNHLRYVLFYEEIKEKPIILLKKILTKLSIITSQRKNYSSTPSFILTDGKKGIKKFRQHENNKNIDVINTHHLDYDIYLKDLLNNENPVINKKTYAVYTDMYLPFSMDTSHGNKKNKTSVSAENFYPVMEKYFDEFEQQIGYDVVIAGSPRSDYSGGKKYLYGDRLVIKNKSHNLIKHSKCVLAHHSTSVNFAVLYNKPIVFLSPIVLNKKLQRRIKYLANVFGQKPMNISINHFPQIKINPINENSYKEYRNNYIKMEETPEKPIWDIFCNYLNSK